MIRTTDVWNIFLYVFKKPYINAYTGIFLLVTVVK